MKTVDLQVDLHAVCESAARHLPADPEIIARVQERADEVRRELRAKGTVNVAVALLRETRDE